MAEATHTGLSDNTVAAISYITLVPAIIFLILPPYSASPYVRFHCWQSIFLNVSATLLWVVVRFALMPVVLVMPDTTAALLRLVWLAWILVFILCALRAVNGKRIRLPLIGALAEKRAGT